MNKLMFLIALLLVVGCTGHVVRDDSVKVGVIVPLTGDLADYGFAIKNGLSMAEEDFELIFEDSKYDSKLAVTAYHKLTEIDNVDLVINFGSPTTCAIAPLIENVPVLGFQAADSTVPYLVRTLNQPKDYMDVLKVYLAENDFNKVGIIKTENSYLNSLYDSFVEDFEGEVVLLNTFQWGETDFRTTILKIQSYDFDAVGVFLGSGSISQFYKQSKEMNLVIPTFGTDFFESLTEIENAQGTMDGAVYSNFVVSDDFAEDYIARFNTKSQLGYAGASYDIMKILVDVDFSSADSIIESFRGVKDFNGVLGTYGFVEKGEDKYLDYSLSIREILS